MPYHTVVAVLEENMSERARASAVAQVSPINVTESEISYCHDCLQRDSIACVTTERGDHGQAA